MGATLIDDEAELAPVLSDTHFPTSEGGKAESVYQCEEIEISAGMNSTGNQNQVARMVAQRSTHYAAAT